MRIYRDAVPRCVSLTHKRNRPEARRASFCHQRFKTHSTQLEVVCTWKGHIGLPLKTEKDASLWLPFLPLSSPALFFALSSVRLPTHFHFSRNGLATPMRASSATSGLTFILYPLALSPNPSVNLPERHWHWNPALKDPNEWECLDKGPNGLESDPGPQHWRHSKLGLGMEVLKTCLI